MSAGRISTWMMNRRSIVAGPGYAPPKNSDASHVPTNGIESTIEYAMRSPVAESRSSGSE